MHHPSSRSAQKQTSHFLPRYATIQIMCCRTFCLQRKSRCTPCDLECMTEFSRRQTTGCVERFSLACYILITRAYERILPCMYCITMYATQNAFCNCEIIVIVNSWFLERPQKRSRRNQLIHRRLTKTKSIGRGQDPESQAGRQLDGYGGWCLELRQGGRYGDDDESG